jgi:polysaccharide chain length determinant protein (PEP-CTERM system associated)
MSDDRRVDTGTVAGAGYGDDSESFRWSQIRHFLHAPLRRPLLVLVPWAAIFLVSIAAVFLLPKKYVSSALVLVESEKVPESFIPKVATKDASERLDAVRPEILSRTRLERVLDETQPYPGLSKTQAVEKIRSMIFINLSGNDGFTISFYHRDPAKAQQVTDRLTRLFIEETVKSRSQQVEGAVDFLVTQVNDARKELEDKDAALRRFKEEHMGKLPSQLETNLATMQMLQRETQAVEESLLFAREKQEALARGIGRSSVGTVPGAGASPEMTELADLNRQLALLRIRYKEAHPDVESLKSRIARLQARLAGARRGEAPAAEGETDTDPQVLIAREQLERATLEVRKLEERQRELQSRMTAIRANVEETPRTEQELATLTRDYKKLDENYTALLSKQLEAQMSGRLEQRWKGERFRVLDPASLPEKPVFPKPPLFLGLGAIVGLAIGLGASLVAEYLDPTVKDSEVLQALQGYPVLASISYLPDLASPRSRATLDAAPHREADVPQGAAKIWEPGLPGEAPFRDEGIVTPRKVVPVIECLQDRNSVVGEELRLYRANLLDVCRRLKVSCLALTSALPGEGKSTLSVGLASALGREPGRRILLIEADLRRPSLMDTLGLPPAHGLSEWLNGTLDYVPVRFVDAGGFFLVAAGQTGLKRPEVLGSPRMDAVLRAARRLFDFVVLDAVPVLPVADTVLMQDLVDGFQLVVRSRRTPRDAIHNTLAKLRPDRVIGVVFNGHREYKTSYKYYGYRRYGMAYDAAPPPTPPGRVARLLVGLKGQR